MNRDAPIRTDIVLLGGGHAHVHVLLAFAMRPEPGLRVTLVARDLETPYSGMLPGMVAGFYRHDEAHIDLVRLAAATGTRLIHGEAVGLDRASKRVLLQDRPPIAYDLVSVDVGILPALDHIAGAAAHAIAVKPIGSFLAKFAALRARCRAPDGPRRIAVIGGGAGGVELLLSVRACLLADAEAAGTDPASFAFALSTDGEILASHNPCVRAAFLRAFSERGVAVHEHAKALTIRQGAIDLEGGRTIAADAVLVTTNAAPPPWFAATGLALDPGGFLAVGPSLQSTGDRDVFAAGDCAALVQSPREKAGVFAVRAGPPLAANLRRRARGEATRAWRPQRRHLALISTGARYAVASRGWFKAEGAWLWTVKDWIDRRWMRMYQDTDRLVARMASAPAPSAAAAAPPELRCGGCAAKVGPGPLSRALARLPAASAAGEGVVLGLAAPDDAAILAAPVGQHLVATVDFFRSFIDDPFVFGAVAANHALNDVFAMGGEPRHAMAIAMVPAGPSAKVEEALYQVMAGARHCLDREGVALVGGHSSEGAELALGFSVSGTVDPARITRKAGLKPGDVLVLTKPVGTGVLFAAAMRARAPAAAIAAALAAMRQSNRGAAAILRAHGAVAMTDVSGFGLVGHLGEMLAAGGAQASLDLTQVPLLDQALALARQGIASTLLPENLALQGLLAGAVDDATRALLFDPQTAGGLLAGIAAERATACLEALRSAGYDRAAAIGRVGQAGTGPQDARIVPSGAIR